MRYCTSCLLKQTTIRVFRSLDETLYVFVVTPCHQILTSPYYIQDGFFYCHNLYGGPDKKLPVIVVEMTSEEFVAFHDRRDTGLWWAA